MSGKHERDLALEGLRGLCALLVVFGHVTYQAPLLDPGYACDLLHVDFGPQAVCVFFVISGYVIGLTTRTPATGAAVRHYATRRLLRIVPTAWTAVLLTGLLLRHDSMPVVVGNLSFLQNSLPYPLGVRIPILYDDPPLWSLSFEMLYYAVFILVWRFALRLRVALIVTIILALAEVVGMPAILSRYAAYFVFWLGGLGIAWHTASAGGDARTPWPASVLAAFAIWRLEPIRSFCAAAPALVKGLDVDRFHLDVLAGSILLVLAVTRRGPEQERRLRAFVVLAGFCVLPLQGLWVRHPFLRGPSRRRCPRVLPPYPPVASFPSAPEPPSAGRGGFPLVSTLLPTLSCASFTGARSFPRGMREHFSCA